MRRTGVHPGLRVGGTDLLSEQDVRRVAAVPEGEPLALVDIAAAQNRVEAMAAVRSADVSREWPDQVRIDVEERVAVAVVELGGRLRGMDSDISRLDADPFRPDPMPGGKDRHFSRTHLSFAGDASVVAASGR